MLSEDELLQIGINSWIIADGNYADFTVGEIRSFALEYYSEVELRSLPKSRAGRSYKPHGRAHYAVEGRTIHQASRWSAIDVGFLAYRQYPSPPPRRFEGEIWVGVDPFFYFETLSLQRGAPPLIFDWSIHRIEVETAPRISQNNMWIYDPAQLCLKDVEDTRRGEDFVLHCERLSAEPRHRLNPS